jgi:hypothetical protein
MSPSRVNLDEQSFQKLLAAAYILQQQRDQLRARQAHDDARRLGEIADAQKAIRTQKISLDSALQLVAERAAAITHGIGAAVYLEGKEGLHCRAASGRSLPRLGESSKEENPSAACLLSDEPYRCTDVRSQIAPPLRVPPASSLFALPLHHDGRAMGFLEVSFESANGFQERDIQISLLLAGMAEEALARDAEEKMKNELAAERASMLAALERLKPELEKLSHTESEGESEPGDAEPSPATAEPASTRPSGMAGLGAFLLNMQAQQVKHPVEEPEPSIVLAQPQHEENTEPEQALQEFSAASQMLPNLAKGDQLRHELALVPNPETEAADEGIRSEEFTEQFRDLLPPDAAEFPSADLEAEEKDVLPGPAEARAEHRWIALWRVHWGDICFVFASAVLAAALLWAVWPRASAANPQTASPTSNLTPLERVLVAMGLAEAPAEPTVQGNPKIKVWVDLQTAIYYCPGADLYGKTPKGRYTTQEDARRDQFEPALRRPCE